jgi:hypothetical protein
MRFLLPMLMVALVGCSSSKPDKALAFTATFDAPPDASVTVYRGKLWENRHLLVFAEFYALVEFDASEEKVAALLRSTKKHFEAFDATDFGFGLKDDERWFAPRDGSRYRGWRSEDGMYVIRSDKTRRVFAMRSEL